MALVIHGDNLQMANITDALKSPNLDVALDLAAAGVPVFPAGPDKRPLFRGWQEKASTDPEQIRK